jgi:hypothetical protein
MKKFKFYEKNDLGKVTNFFKVFIFNTQFFYFIFVF